MNKDNQNLTSENPLDPESPEESSSQPQQTDTHQTVAPLEQTVAPLEQAVAPLEQAMEPFLQLVSPIVEALVPIIQNYLPIVRYLYTNRIVSPLQHISFPVNPPTTFHQLERPRSFGIVPVPGNISRSTSTSGAQSSHLQQLSRYPTGAFAGSSLTNQSPTISEECQQGAPASVSHGDSPSKRLRKILPSPSKGLRKILPSPSKRLRKILPSPSKKHKTGPSSLLAESSPSKEATGSKEKMTAIHQKQEALSSPTNKPSTSKGLMTAIHHKEEALSSPTNKPSTSKGLMTAIHPKQKKGVLSPPSKKHVRGTLKEPLAAGQKKKALFSPVETTQVLREQVTTERLKQNTGRSPILGESNSSSVESSNPSQHSQASQDTASVSGEQRQTYELSSSKRQKSRSFSCSTELQFASRKHETTIGTKQKTRTFSHPVETFASRKEEVAVSLENEEEKQSTPVKTMSASIEKATSECFEQQTGQRLIPGEPKSSLPESSLPESSLKNSFSEDYKALQGTKIEKVVDRLVERLKQFDEFICVTCRAKFTSQDELLRHEPIHFND